MSTPLRVNVHWEEKEWEKVIRHLPETSLFRWKPAFVRRVPPPSRSMCAELPRSEELVELAA